MRPLRSGRSMTPRTQLAYRFPGCRPQRVGRPRSAAQLDKGGRHVHGSGLEVLEVVVGVGRDVGGWHGRLVALDDLPVAADEELGEVPLDLVCTVRIWPDPEDRLIELAVLRAEVPWGLGPQVLVQRVGGRAGDLDLGEHREGGSAGGLAERLILGTRTPFLLLDLLPWTPQDR